MNKRIEPELAAARVEKVRRILTERPIVSVADLSRDLQVSPATIRRDLRTMERARLVRRVHGGAIASDSRLTEPLFDDKTSLATNEKHRIARKALTFIKPRDSIFLDGGSTVLTLAGLLQGMTDVTVVTNSLRVVMCLSGAGPRVILVGGEFRRLSQTFVGSLSSGILDRLHLDTAFMGTIGLSAAEGMTTTDPREAFTKEQVISHARQVILLADGTKVGNISFVRFGSVENVNVLITDSGAPRRELDRIKKRGVRLVIG
ncbi:MAG: hypothetical protein A2340_13395 [Lentisphaerae bacterium RIFOXYB12_FULL_60_10]|nr:MAG: hypothetical protein A2340_13395 [Lentisphaerae bacterium RIFOXYB12_FULL_60_10]